MKYFNQSNCLYKLKDNICFISDKKDFLLSNNEIIKLCKSVLLSKNNITSLLDYAVEFDEQKSDILLYQYKFLYQDKVLFICLSPVEFKKLFEAII